MAKKTSRFLIGLFVFGGVLIGAAAVIWLGATRYFKKSTVYVTYFDESVQGLSKDSAVRYRGVDVGRVGEITIAPDDRLVEVLLNLYRPGVIRGDTMARLGLAGLSGGVYVSLAPATAAERKQTPVITFPVKYPLIPSRPSEVAKLESGVEAAGKEIGQMDLKDLSEQLKSTAKAMEDFVAGKRMDRIMANLDATSSRLARTIGRVDKLFANGGRVDDLLGRTRDTLTGARELIGSLQEDVKKMQLVDTAGKANRLVTDLDTQTRAIAAEFRQTSVHLRQASENLDALLERLRTTPSDLIWSKPPPVREKTP